MKKIVFENQFFVLLLSLLGLIFISPYLAGTFWGRWAAFLLLFFVVVAVVFMAFESKKYLYEFLALSCAILIIHALFLITNRSIFLIIDLITSAFFYAFIIAVISFKILEKSKITANIIFAALCIYLLLGVFYASLYWLLETVSPGSFLCNIQNCSEFVINQFNLIYFSFTALTTTGFGDLIPATPHAKSLVILEEITGVLYLAAIVSKLVSSFK